MEYQYPYAGWRGFQEGSWVHEIDLRSFIRHNFTMYDGDESFLEGPTQNTLDLWDQVMDLTRQEREAGGVLDMDTHVISTITSHGGYGHPCDLHHYFPWSRLPEQGKGDHRRFPD